MLIPLHRAGVSHIVGRRVAGGPINLDAFGAKQLQNAAASLASPRRFLLGLRGASDATCRLVTNECWQSLARFACRRLTPRGATMNHRVRQVRQVLAKVVRRYVPGLRRAPHSDATQAILQDDCSNAADDLVLLFNAEYYREMNAELTLPSDQLFSHFLRRGWREGRSPHPIFDLPFYMRTNHCVVDQDVNPVQHFLDHGWREGRNPNRLFDCRYYLQIHPDVAAADMNPLLHYLRYGSKELRVGGPLFDTRSYTEFHPECLTSGVDPMSHYLWRGIRLGHAPLPLSHLRVPMLIKRSIHVRGAEAPLLA
jgi:hypothetical protein